MGLISDSSFWTVECSCEEKVVVKKVKILKVIRERKVKGKVEACDSLNNGGVPPGPKPGTRRISIYAPIKPPRIPDKYIVFFIVPIHILLLRFLFLEVVFTFLTILQIDFEGWQMTYERMN